MQIPAKAFKENPITDINRDSLAEIRITPDKTQISKTFYRTHLVDLIAYIGATSMTILHGLNALIFYYQYFVQAKKLTFTLYGEAD